MPEKQLTVADRVPAETAIAEAKNIKDAVLKDCIKSDDSLKVHAPSRLHLPGARGRGLVRDGLLQTPGQPARRKPHARHPRAALAHAARAPSLVRRVCTQALIALTKSLESKDNMINPASPKWMATGKKGGGCTVQ